MSEYINNPSQREAQLKAIIRELHAGKSVDEVKAAFAELLADVGPDEIVRIEEALVEEGLDPEEIQPLCDVHVAVFRDSLDEQQAPETMPGHPIFTYRAENLGVQRVLDQLEAALEACQTSLNETTWQRAKEALSKLLEYDRHYLRKENLLFPYLELSGFSGPTKVMWGVHDEIREMWKALAVALDRGPQDPDAMEALVAEHLPPLAQAIRDMIYKEDHILFPAALSRLNDREWAAIRRQGDEIGYCYARPGRAWVPDLAGSAEPASAEEAVRSGKKLAGTEHGDGLLPLNTGALTVEQIDGVLQSLPLDITFVDEYDEVRYFSQSQERIFQRSPAIIGRKVQNCHPPQSVDRVQQILDDFRAGVRDVAEFWIQMQGMFVHIRYFAIRDDAGIYKGTIEVTQNLTPLRALEGERRLLDD